MRIIEGSWGREPDNQGNKFDGIDAVELEEYIFASRGKYGVLRTPILKVVLALFMKALEKNGYKIVKER